MSFFVSQKSLQTWLDDYAVSHQNPTNKSIHWLCVPVIFLCIVALLYHVHIGLLGVIAVGVLLFYLRLSLVLFMQMAAFMAICVMIAYYLPVLVWFWVGLFVVAWIGQFVGHKIEGAKPSFFEDLQFLLIGPAWVVRDMGRRLSS